MRWNKAVVDWFHKPTPDLDQGNWHRASPVAASLLLEDHHPGGRDGRAFGLAEK